MMTSQKSLFASLSVATRIVLTLAGAAVAAVVLVALVLRVRDRQVDSLYISLIAQPHGSAEQLRLVKEIAKYPSAVATQKLMMVAAGSPNTPFPNLLSDTSAMAIRELHSRGGQDVAVKIAQLLQPQTSLEVRLSAAEELRTRPCNSLCIEQVLHYLERQFHGEVDIDVRLGSGVEAYLAADRQKLAVALNDILKRNQSATLDVLESVYGLGSVVPSEFGVRAAAGIPISDSCPLLLASRRAQQSWKVPETQPLSEAVTSLHCQ